MADRKLTAAEQEELNKLMEDYNNLTEEQLKRVLELQGAERKRKEDAREQLDYAIRRLDTVTAIAEELNKIQKAQEKTAASERDGFAFKQRQLLINRQTAEMRKLISQAAADEMVRDGKISDSTQERIKALGLQDKLLGQNAETLAYIASNEDARYELSEKLNKEARTMNTTQGKLVGFLDEVFFLTEETNRELAKQVLQKRAIEKMDQTISFFFRKSVDALMEMDKIQSEFNKNFQFGPEYTGRILETTKSLNEFGVTTEKASKAQASLINIFTDFTMVSADLRDELTNAAALAGQLGVSTESFARGIQNSTKFFGQNVESAIQIQGDLAATARELGVSQDQLTSQFAQSGGALAKFGDQGVSTFKNLSRVAKITGLDLERILSITNKFDTFVGAAEQAGQLNAALGGNFVNAMDLMMATDPVERFNMIRDSILDTGLSFNDMSYYQKEFYKNALGLSDIGELALVLSGNTDMLTGSLNASSEELVEQKKRAQAALNIQEKFQAIIADNSEFFMGLAEGINSFISALMFLSPLIKFVILPIFVTLRAFTIAQATATQFLMLVESARKAALVKGNAVKKLSTFLTGKDTIAKSSNTAATGANVAAIEAQTVAMGSLSAAAAPAAAAMGTVALSIVGIGAAIGIVIGSIAYLVNSFANLFTSVAGLAETDGLATVATEVKKIAAAIDEVPVIKTFAFSSVLDSAVAAAGVTGGGGAAATAGNVANATAAAAGGGATVVKQPIQLYFDDRMLSEFVAEVIGEQVKIVQTQTQ